MEKTLNIRISDELKEEAQKKALAEGESLSVIVRQMIRKWVKETA